MELRKDYILDKWVYISTDRSKRKHEFKTSDEPDNSDSKNCFFCPGNENTTPPEIGRIEEDGKWIIRWFPNKFPAVRKEGNPIIETHNNFYTFASGYGSHEVITETPDHKKQLWDLPANHIQKILYVIKDRIAQLINEENIKYVIVFKNHGKDAGTSLVHSHTQVASLNKVPQTIKEKLCAVKKYQRCPYCKIIESEKNSERRCFENNTFVAFTPYASRFNYEIWIFPKRHIKNLSEMNDYEFTGLSEIMEQILKKLKQMGAAYNLYYHYAPKDEDLHFHIEITPRIAKWAGFEIGSGDIINAVMPEDAARFYRGEE